jgi:uncharacterized protein (DUF983 family)
MKPKSRQSGDMEPIALPAPRSWTQASLRGFAKCCPSCGDGALYDGYLTVHAACPSCGTELHHQQADDAPPYLTIFVVGHIVVPLLLVVEKLWHPEMWIHFAVWPALTLALTLWLLPRIKGMVVGLQWAFGMHGFGASDEAEKTGLSHAP